ncbi:alkaline phosphatase family protein [Aneurinibacillus tyrosinisolvens]|uniref:alkaline phosphatase family protein n=1 Tax=Aneurinibacillus tyrosinisolvens TaxID=1443435 RepID=UPI000ABD1FE9|nr:alkaline phosphatase family protein [Aneurinibacillus tyrosinisolvens]
MKQSKTRKKALTLAAAGIVALSSFFATPVSSILAAENHSNHEFSTFKGKASTQTTTPIKHVVVIFGENVSFDHYFGTYPNAKNLPGEPVFKAAKNTPKVNGLTQELLTNNPNKDLNGNTVNPQRMSPSQAMTDSMDHNYTSEQKAQNGGKMDQYVPNGGRNNPVVMNYFDGNTVTGFWNYAQNFAMSDNSFNTTFGPSTPGALNLISGQTHGATVYENDKNDGELNVPREVMNGTVIGDPDPQLDKASNHPKTTVTMSGKNVGDLLNKKDITWGWFQGGFADPKAQHANIAGKMQTDYNPHHEPFQYYPQTANKDHLPLLPQP